MHKALLADVFLHDDDAFWLQLCCAAFEESQRIVCRQTDINPTT
jgi:hypothetical protein